jgi:hypothetical protein
MVAVSPQLEKYNQAMKKEKNLSFDILSDPGNQVAAQYGIKYKMADILILRRAWSGFRTRWRRVSAAIRNRLSGRRCPPFYRITFYFRTKEEA